MAMDNYEGPGTVFIGARLLAEATRVRATVNSNNRPVFTMRKGLAGKSDGPSQAEVQVDSAVPKGGLEDEFVEKCVKGAIVRIVMVVAGRRYSFEGWIDTASVEQSQDDAASVSFTATTRAPLIL